MNTKGTETVNDEGATETKVDTVDHRTSAGRDQQPTDEKVGVVHLTRNKKESGKSSGGFLGSATGAVTRTFKSAKDYIKGKGKDESSTTTTG